MTATLRDPWEDARVAAAPPVLDADVLRVRRRIWFRRALPVLLVGVVLIVLIVEGHLLIDEPEHELWPVSFPLAMTLLLGLSGVGLVLMMVSTVRSSRAGAEKSFVGPEDFLPRGDRAWLRAQIASGRAVPEGRFAVALGTARRMVRRSYLILNNIGLVCFYVGLTLGSPTPSTVVLFSALTLWLLVEAVRARVWSRRARRWLARNA